MTIEVHFTRDGRGVVWASRGRITLGDFRQADAEIRADPERSQRLRYLLVDHMLAAGIGIDAQDVRWLNNNSRESARTRPEGGLIAVACPSKVLYGLSRMWSLMIEDVFETTVTWDAQCAAAWLERRCRERYGLAVAIDPLSYRSAEPDVSPA